jgi:hypothetical protein
MPKLKLHSIKFGEPEKWHFVTFTFGEHETDIIEDRHHIEIEVMVPSSTELEKAEKMAFDKARTFIKQLAESI